MYERDDLIRQLAKDSAKFHYNEEVVRCVIKDLQLEYGITYEATDTRDTVRLKLLGAMVREIAVNRGLIHE